MRTPRYASPKNRQDTTTEQPCTMCGGLVYYSGLGDVSRWLHKANELNSCPRMMVINGVVVARGNR